MNWKSTTIEPGFIRQDPTLTRESTATHIPFEQVDTFGIQNLENKYWLCVSVFFGICSVFLLFSDSPQSVFITLTLCTFLAVVYFKTKKDCLFNCL